MKTSILLDHEPVADGGFLVRALLRIEGDPPADDARVPLNLSLVLDRSGSMSGPPLRAARDAACMLVRRLRTEDTVSVVAYDHEVTVIAPPATGAQQEGLSSHIAAIESGGSTNLSGGWLRGRDLIAENLRDGGVNRILLLTDGLANVGIKEPGALIGLCRSAAALGISTTTVGFGPDYDEDLLRAMADAGHGGTYYIERVDQAGGVFEEELEGLLSLAAQNVRVRIRPGADAESVKVAHQYPSHAEGPALTLEVGDLYAREPRRVLLEFLLSSEAPIGSSADVGEITVTAHVLTADGGVELRTITLPISLSPEEGGKVEPEVRKEVLLVAAARARDEALEAERRGDYQAGSSILREAASYLTSAPYADATVAEEIDDLRAMERSLDQGSLSAQDIKYMKQRSHDSNRSRHLSKERTRRTKED